MLTCSRKERREGPHDQTNFFKYTYGSCLLNILLTSIIQPVDVEKSPRKLRLSEDGFRTPLYLKSSSV